MSIANVSNIVSVGDVSQFTASLWVIPPPDGSNISNFQFVDLVVAETNDANRYIRLQISFNTTLVGGVTPTRAVNYDCNNFIAGDPGNKSWGGSSIVNAYTPGSWHHFFIGMDTSGINTGHCYVNLVDRTDPNTSNDTGFLATVNACKFGLPTTPEDSVVQTTKLQMAEVQIWFGTFIGPTAENLAKFVKISNGRGLPEDPARASAAFGTPTYSFRGQPAQFIINRGNGGSVSQTGAINDYTPTPSY